MLSLEHQERLDRSLDRRKLVAEFTRSCMDLYGLVEGHEDETARFSELQVDVAHPSLHAVVQAQKAQADAKNVLSRDGHLLSKQWRQSESGLSPSIWKAVCDTGLFTKDDVDEAVVAQVSAIPMEMVLTHTPPRQCCENAFQRIKITLADMCGAASSICGTTNVRYRGKRIVELSPVEPSDSQMDIEFMAATRCVDRSGVDFKARLIEGQEDYDDAGEPASPYPVLILKLESPCSQRKHLELLAEAMKLTKVLNWVLSTLPACWRLPSAVGVKSQVPLDDDTIAPAGIWRTAFRLYFSDARSHLGQTVRNAVEYAGLIANVQHPSARLVLAVAALESLLTPGTSETTQKVARRSAYLLAPSAHVRSKWRDQFSSVYERRSRFVHGDSPNVTESESQSALIWFAEVMRALLHYYQLRWATEASVENSMKEIDNDFCDGRELPTGFIACGDLAEELGVKLE